MEKSYIICFDRDQEQKPDWQEIFGNDNPLWVEIGPGKGQFFIDIAEREPDKNFVVLEIRRKRVEKINSKLMRTDLENGRILLGNGKEILQHLFPIESVEVFFIHFPDPWPKKRHIKRRLLDVDILVILHKLLAARGKIYLTTDVAVYAETIDGLFQEHGGFDREYRKYGEYDSEYHRTIHEKKFRMRNRTIHYFCFSKK